MGADLNFRTDRVQNVGSRTLFYPISIMLPNFIEDSSNLKHPKNVKSINNIAVSYLVSCRVIPRPGTIKGLGNKVFWKILALGNIKYDKSNKLKSRYNHWKNTDWFTRVSKSNCFAKHILMAISVFHILQCFTNTNTNNILIYLASFEAMFC